MIQTLLKFAKKSSPSAARELALAATSSCGPDAQHARALVSVLADLLTHGWQFKLVDTEILGRDAGEPDGESHRDYVRQIQLQQREQQLRKASVREFVRSMEKKRLGPTGWSSIFSLMRDGRELAAALHGCPVEALVPTVIDPYVEVIRDSKQRCQFTGLRLMDVWRYFRYTWAMPYNSVPGRSMLILIRDAAAPNHPVVGLAALGSAIVQLSQRDKWIGWTAKDFVRAVEEQPKNSISRWVLRQLTALIDAIYKGDLLRSGIIARRELRAPSEETIQSLRREAERCWKIHRQFPSQSVHKANGSGEKHWKERAESPLFRAKRSETLAQLMQVRRAMNDVKYEPTVAGLKRLVSTSAGRRAIEILLRASKSEHVGIDMLDITICGAIPPYNPILGGKLTAMLMCSPEIVREYAKRYKAATSIIASSMAGQSVQRPPRLVLLGTTSLYGERLNQYHRVQLPAGIAGAKEAIRYVYLGESVGFGSSHLCRETVEELELLLSQSSRGRRVNSIFGEGVSPRLRKIRDGLDSLGFPSDRILNHGNPRLIYGIPLARNFREALIGLEKEPRYILPQTGSMLVTSSIARYWCTRWLAPRIENHPDVLESVAANDLRLPDRHLARVNLPAVKDEFLPLFS